MKYVVLGLNSNTQNVKRESYFQEIHACLQFCLHFQMLAEVGYQAGQHEVLAESFSKDVYKHLHDEAKKLKESRRKNIKESDKLVNELNSAFKSMHSSKEKFRKAFDDHERAQQAFSK